MVSWPSGKSGGTTSGEELPDGESNFVLMVECSMDKEDEVECPGSTSGLRRRDREEDEEVETELWSRSEL